MTLLGRSRHPWRARRWVRIVAAYHVWLALRLYLKALIFVSENGGFEGASFALMRNPEVQRQWAEFLYGQVSGYGYGETAHWAADEVVEEGAVSRRIHA